MKHIKANLFLFIFNSFPSLFSLFLTKINK
jgi:hypothetical protein